MNTPPLQEPASVPIFILFDTQTGYLYGHLFATGPEDPFSPGSHPMVEPVLLPMLPLVLITRA